VNERASVGCRFSAFSVTTKKPWPEIDRSVLDVVWVGRPWAVTNRRVWAVTPPAA